MTLSKYHIIQYILETFPKNEYDYEVLDQNLIEVSRIFGKKHTLINGLSRIHASNKVLLEILPLFMPNIYDCDCAWKIRRDAGNVRACVQKQNEIFIDKQISFDIEEQRINELMPLYKKLLDEAIQKRNDDLTRILNDVDL